MKTKVIPRAKDLDWQIVRSIPITGSDEKLIDTKDFHPRILTQSDYFRQKINYALPTCYLRESAAKRLIQAVNLLPEGTNLLLWDGWRPYELQKELQRIIGEEINIKFAHEPEDVRKDILSKFVAEPSKDPNKPSPHLTGGSIDLTLCDANGKALDMGTPFDAPEDDSWTHAFEEKAPSDAQINRRMLYWAMINAGFSNLPTEWWHYDFGNQLWACYTEQSHALYSVASI